MGADDWVKQQLGGAPKGAKSKPAEESKGSAWVQGQLGGGGGGGGAGQGGTVRDDPRYKLANAVNRLQMLVDSGTISEKRAKKLRKTIQASGVDLDSDTAAKIVDSTGKPDSGAERVFQSGTSLVGKTLRQVSRPGQAVMSGFAEYNRQVERNPYLGFMTKEGDPGELLKATREGWNLQRHDTFGSMRRETGDIRESQGRSRRAQYLGPIKGGDIATNPLNVPEPLRGVTNTALDIGAAAVLDPLTYVTVGTGGAAKAGLRTAEGIIGADRAAVLATKGLRGLDDAERALLAERMAPKAFESLSGVRGGVGVRLPHLPTPARLREGQGMLGPTHTLVSGATFGKAAAPLRPLTRAVAGSKPAAALGDIFRPRDALRRGYGQNAADALDDARVRYKGGLQAGIEDDVARLSATIQEAKATTEELETIVAPALDIGGGTVPVPERLRPVVAAFADVRDKLTTAQLDAGLLTEQTMHETGEYFPRVLTDKGRELFDVDTPLPGGARLAAAPSASGMRDPFRRGRTFETDKPVAAINAELAERAGGPVFDPNPATAFANRIARGRKAVASKGFVDEVLKIKAPDGSALARPIDDFVQTDERLGEAGRILRSGDVELPAGYVEVDVPQVGRFGMPEELAGEVRRVLDLEVNDQALAGIVRGLDRWQQLWKGYATVPFVFGLGFHERNAIGNVFNNWLAGIDFANPAYARAMTLQRRVGKGLKEGDAYKYLGAADRELVEAARKYDIIGEGFYGTDLATDMEKRIRVGKRTAAETAKAVGRRSNPLSVDNAVIASGRKIGSAIESNARLAHFIAKAGEMGDYAEAARSARKYLFDYSDLTAVEKQAFKRIHSFYTFTRKNLPLQVANLVRQPGKFARMQQARVAVADQAPNPEGMYPGYLDELAGTPLPMGVSELLSKIPGMRFDPNTQLVLAPDLPPVAAGNSLTPLVNLLSEVPGLGFLPGNEEGAVGALGELLSQNVVGGAPGAASTVAQAALGRDLFSGRTLQAGRREAAPVWAEPFAQERMVGGEMEPTITTRQRFILQGLMPMLSKTSGTFPRGENEQDKAPRRRLSALTGVRVYPLGESTQRSEAYRRLDQINRVIQDLEAQGTDVPQNRRRRRR